VIGVRDQDQTAISPRKEDLGQRIFGARIHPALDHRKKRIWLFGHFGLGNGLGNFGNESTLRAILYHLRHLLPDAEVSCICTGPAATAATYNVRALPINRPIIKAWKPRSRVARVLRSVFIGIPSEIYRWIEGLMTLNGTDVLLVPGTGLITDAYSLRGWGPYSVFKWSLIAKMRGCKLLFVSVGAGPIYSRLGRFLVKSALALADFRSYRDASSLQYLKSLGFVTTHDRVYPDLAFSLPKDLIARDCDRNRRRPVVGLGVMLDAGKYNVDKPDGTSYQKYLENLVILVSWLLAREYDVRLLIGDLCDRSAMEEFKCLLKERLPLHDASRIIDDEVASVEQLLSQLAQTDLVIATRFHNVLLALLNNKPVIAISFHHKVASLMDAMGLSGYCLDINHFKGEELIAKVCDAERNVGTLTSLIRERAENCREALEEQYHLITNDFLLGQGRETRKTSLTPLKAAGPKRP
jgi:polysaccharide pyruvyl transferase WcaK-like protein